MHPAVRARVDEWLRYEPLPSGRVEFKEAWRAQRAACAALPSPDYEDGIPDRDFLEAVDALTQPDFRLGWATFWDMVDVFGLPEDELRVKAADLIDRELLCGCTCGCRGDLSPDDWGLYERPTVGELLERAT